MTKMDLPLDPLHLFASSALFSTGISTMTENECICEDTSCYFFDYLLPFITASGRTSELYPDLLVLRSVSSMARSSCYLLGLLRFYWNFIFNKMLPMLLAYSSSRLQNSEVTTLATVVDCISDAVGRPRYLVDAQF